MSTDLRLFDEDDLVSRLVHGHQDGRPFVFLVGSPLTAPTGPATKGVPGVAALIERVRTILAGEYEMPAPGPETPYQSAFRLLQGRRGPGAVNRLVREAVLEACESDDSERREQAAAGNGEACRLLEGELGGWSLSPGVEGLGRLLASCPTTFGGTILTTNFDPLLGVAIQRAGGSAWSVALHGEGDLEAARADGCCVVHAHGRWDRTDTLHTPSQLLQPRPRLKASLGRLFLHSGLVVVAYGGWNDIFTKTILELVADGGAFPEILWTFWEEDPRIVQEKFGRLLAGLAPGIGRGRVLLYGGVDCHRFFPHLLREVSAGSGAGTTPAPTPVAPAAARGASPFVAGPPITRDEDLFGRSMQRGMLEDALRAGQPVELLGEQRMGKTSLLRWVERHAGEWQARPVAWVNAQGLAGRSPRDLVLAAAWSLGRLPEAESALAENKDLPEPRAAERALLPLLPLVLLVDEAANLASPGHGFDEAFLDHLRALGQDGKLVWVSASRESLYQLFRQGQLNSHFLNDSRKVAVGQIEPSAAASIVERILSPEEVEEALDALGGFALGLQYLGDQVFRGIEFPRALDATADHVEPFFEGWWKRCSDEERTLLRLAASGLVLASLDREGRRRARRLVGRGLLTEAEGCFTLPGSFWMSHVRHA